MIACARMSVLKELVQRSQKWPFRTTPGKVIRGMRSPYEKACPALNGFRPESSRSAFPFPAERGASVGVWGRVVSSPLEWRLRIREESPEYLRWFTRAASGPSLTSCSISRTSRWSSWPRARASNSGFQLPFSPRQMVHAPVRNSVSKTSRTRRSAE